MAFQGRRFNFDVFGGRRFNRRRPREAIVQISRVATALEGHRTHWRELRRSWKTIVRLVAFAGRTWSCVDNRDERSPTTRFSFGRGFFARLAFHWGL